MTNRPESSVQQKTGYALMQMGMNANKQEDVLSGQYGLFALSCLFWIAAMFALAWVLLKRRDVKG